jgi:hypothetical protein
MIVREERKLKHLIFHQLLLYQAIGAIKTRIVDEKDIHDIFAVAEKIN